MTMFESVSSTCWQARPGSLSGEHTFSPIAATQRREMHCSKK